MIKHYTIERVIRDHYMLCDKDEFEDEKRYTIGRIDYMLDYLTKMREKIDAVTLGSNGNELSKLVNGLYSEYEMEGVQETSGCCADVIEAIWRFIRVADNLYNQERYAGKIEENWTHFK